MAPESDHRSIEAAIGKVTEAYDALEKLHFKWDKTEVVTDIRE
jgi:hypothetical protein